MTPQHPADSRPLDDIARAAATAAGAVPGVHALGSLFGRASDAVRERVGLAGTVSGVKVDEAGTRGLTTTVSLIVDYPHPLHTVADAVRRAVRTAVAPLTDREVDVDVVVTGVWGPFDREVVLESPDDDATETPASPDPDTAGLGADGRTAAPQATTATAPAAVVTTTATAEQTVEATESEKFIAEALEDAAIDIQLAAEEVRENSDGDRA